MLSRLATAAGFRLYDSRAWVQARGVMARAAMMLVIAAGLVLVASPLLETLLANLRSGICFLTTPHAASLHQVGRD